MQVGWGHEGDGAVWGRERDKKWWWVLGAGRQKSAAPLATSQGSVVQGSL